MAQAEFPAVVVIKVDVARLLAAGIEPEKTETILFKRYRAGSNACVPTGMPGDLKRNDLPLVRSSPNDETV